MATRAQRIEVLERCLEWVTQQEGERRALGDPHGFYTEERRALEWALPLLREHTADANRREELRVEAVHALREAQRAVAAMRELDPTAQAADAARHGARAEVA